LLTVLVRLSTGPTHQQIGRRTAWSLWTGSAETIGIAGCQRPQVPDGHHQITIDKMSLCWRANVRVEEFMTRWVVTITPDTPLLVDAKLMVEHRVGGLPVLNASGRIIGIFSQSDLLRRGATPKTARRD
jgi:CBS domain